MWRRPSAFLSPFHNILFLFVTAHSIFVRAAIIQSDTHCTIIQSTVSNLFNHDNLLPDRDDDYNELTMSMATRMPPGKRSRPWADLPTELVDAVVSRLELDVFSAARLAAVRAPWARTVAAANPYLPFGAVPAGVARVQRLHL